MKPTRWTLAVLGMLCLANGTAASAAREEEYALKCRSNDRVLEIYAAHPVDPARCAAIVARVMKAFAFVAGRSDWKDRGPLTARPLQFALVGEDAINVLGYAQGPDLMVMKDSYLDKPLSEGTLAHELAHIQDARQLRGKRMPSFLFEGRALVIGQAYRLHVGQSPGDYDRQMARSAATFTAEQAMELLDNFRGHGWNNQAIGTVVVEYMRTRWKGGIPDVIPRLSRLIERIAAGRDFEQAFADEFGTSAEAFAEAFAAHLRATQGDTAARLQGTMWQSVGTGSGTAAAPRDAYVSDVVDLLGELLK
ncbi:MAG: hypothetical protein NDI88_14180 [Lysobacter sp.]|nr:hypothetical protein [Lysobacter sp.]